MVKRRAKPISNVSDPEYLRFAEQFVELIVDPKQGWMVAFILNGGLDHVRRGI